MRRSRLQLEFAPRSRGASPRGLALLLVSALLFATQMLAPSKVIPDGPLPAL